MRPYSITKKIILSICLFLSVLLGGIASVTYFYFQNATRSMVFDQQVALVTATAKGLDEKILSSRDILLQFSKSLPLALLDDKSNISPLQNWLESNQLVNSIFTHDLFLLDEQGKLLVFTGHENHCHAKDCLSKLHTQSIGTPEVYISPPRSCPVINHPIITMTAIIYDQAGKRRGLIGGGFDLLAKEGLFSGLLNLRIGSTGYPYLFAQDRTMILHPDPARIMKKDVPLGANKLFDKAIEGFDGAGETVNSRGMHTLVSFKHLETVDWILAFNFPVKEAYAPIVRFRNYYLLGMTGCLLISILLAVKLSAIITRPLHDLVAQAKKMGKAERGGTHSFLDNHYTGEIATLASAFNELLGTLNQKMSAFELNLQIVFDNTDKGIIIHDQQGRILAVNRPAQRMFASDEATLLTLSVLDLSAETVAKNEQIPQMIHQVMNGEVMLIEWRCRKLSDNSFFDSEIYYTRISWNNEPVLMEMVQDVTTKKQQDALIHRLSTAIEQSANTVVVTDRKGVIQYANPSIQAMTGYSVTEVLGKTSQILKSGVHSPEFYKKLWATILSGQTWRGELCNRHKRGYLIWESAVITPIVEQGAITHFVAIKEDISLRKQQEEVVYRLANYDELTGFPNRNLLSRRFRDFIADTKNDGCKIVLMLLDLDDFKTVNDTLGHSVSDRLLQAVAARLQSCLAPEDMLARLGGDEFCIVLFHDRDKEQVAALASRLMKSFAQAFDRQEQDIFITASMGIAVYPKDGQDMENLLRNADAAMYHAKNNGHNAYAMYYSALNEFAHEKLQVTGRLRRALERNEFLLYYQPQQELTSGKIVGFETLLRWHPKDGPVIFPDTFISLLEETGMIVSVGEWVLREVCHQVQRWLACGLVFERASVNLSFRQFQRPDIVERILAVIEESGINPATICLELTESIMMDNFEENLAKLHALRKAGLLLSLDDFGTGYSSLSYLRRMQIHELKIDRSFIQALPEHTTLVTTILAVAHNLGLQVVAEGVETEVQRDFLASHNCESIQGYFLSRPLSGEQFETFVRSFNNK